MKPSKTFDCVAMKNEIQERRAARYKGMTDEEIRERIETNLATSDEPLAVWWRGAGAVGRSKTNRMAGKQAG